MITVTSEAADEIRAMLKHSRARPDQGVKVSPNGHGGLILSIAAAAEGDTIVAHDDVPLLIVAKSIASALDGLVFDCLLGEFDGRSSKNLTFRHSREGDAGVLSR